MSAMYRVWPRRAAIAAVTGLALIAGVSGCSKKSERVYFDGNYYPTRARTTDKADRTFFAVNVRRADQGLAGAREAGRHGGQQYCIDNFGTSDIVWTVGPDAPQAALTGGRGGLTLTGKCKIW